MLKFELLANVGDTIKAYDFKGMQDRYIQGKIIDKGDIKHPTYGSVMYRGYSILIAEDSGSTSGGRVGDIGYVPFETDFMEYDERVTLV
jgi:hypothetical protein